MFFFTIFIFISYTEKTKTESFTAKQSRPYQFRRYTKLQTSHFTHMKVIFSVFISRAITPIKKSPMHSYHSRVYWVAKDIKSRSSMAQRLTK